MPFPFAAAVLIAAQSVPGASVPAPQAPAAQPAPAADGSQATGLNARDDGYDRLTVAVRVAGQGPYQFLLDTGASRSAISSDVAARLGLAPAPSATLHSVTGSVRVSTARVPLLDWTATSATEVDAALLEASNMGADGILGLDMLRSQRILFDFARKTLTVIPSDMRIREDPDAIVITGRARSGRLILSNAHAGRTALTLVVDTGAQISVGNAALRAKLSREQVLEVGGTAELTSVTGQTLAGTVMIVPEIEVGGVKLRHLPIVFADSDLFKALRLDQKPAMLLGMNALRGFKKISIDVGRRTLRVVLPEQSAVERSAFAAL